MSDAAGDRSPSKPGMFDLTFLACFGAAAILLTVLWFAAIAWSAWQLLHRLFNLIFG